MTARRTEYLCSIEDLGQFISEFVTDVKATPGASISDLVIDMDDPATGTVSVSWTWNDGQH